MALCEITCAWVQDQRQLLVRPEWANQARETGRRRTRRVVAVRHSASWRNDHSVADPINWTETSTAISQMSPSICKYDQSTSMSPWWWSRRTEPILVACSPPADRELRFLAILVRVLTPESLHCLKYVERRDNLKLSSFHSRWLPAIRIYTIVYSQNPKWNTAELHQKNKKESNKNCFLHWSFFNRHIKSLKNCAFVSSRSEGLSGVADENTVNTRITRADIFIFNPMRRYNHFHRFLDYIFRHYYDNCIPVV